MIEAVGAVPPPAPEAVEAPAAPGFAAALSRASSALAGGSLLTLGEYLAVADGTAPSGRPAAVLGGTAGASHHAGSADWAAALPAEAGRWVPAVEAAARDAGLDPALLAAVVWAESDFRPDAVSSAGALGLAQLMPATAALLGVDPHDPIQNLSGGARFLASTIERFGRIDLGLAAYNAGPARVAAGDIPSSTTAYVERVLGYVNRMRGAP
jgi:soluble lytic murein transglycosylase-like protein